MAHIEAYLRTPITMEQLILFSQSELDRYSLYVEQDFDSMDENSILFLDNAIVVDDNDSEIHPKFAREKNLDIYFMGQVAYDIIFNTKHQLKPKVPSISDYINNFNYYSKYDCFINF